MVFTFEPPAMVIGIGFRMSGTMKVRRCVNGPAWMFCIRGTKEFRRRRGLKSNLNLKFIYLR